ncbi:MAG: sugar transferase [Armatimonadetes bacterium]|nr:sugar transferase [Armatimonadota bacterium]
MLSYYTFKRALDIVYSSVLLVVLAAPLLLLAWAIKRYDRGPALFWQLRVGRGRRLFRMAKFRTMKVGTVEVSTEEMQAHCASCVTGIGAKLRSTSVDELPQLWNVLLGEMSFIGPRPALQTQTDVNELREEKGVHALRPGITGLAQISGRDDLATDAKVAYDAEYLRTLSFWTDLRILGGTVTAVLKRRGAK